jgi:hypothetical protein
MSGCFSGEELSVTLFALSLYGRAVRVLKSAEVILAEDTRHSARLLQHYDITTPMVSNPLVLVFRFRICFTLSGNAADIRF